MEQRGMREMELNLTETQKKQMWQYILQNNMPENRAYRYDFFFDNCATLIRDLLVKVYGDSLVFYEHPQAGKYSFRNLIDENLAIQPWSDFGIDLGLGAKTDKKISNTQMMFLPLKMEEIIGESEVSGKPLVAERNVLLNYPDLRKKPSLLTTPSASFWALLLLGAAILFFRFDLGARIFDGLFFTVLGLAGVVVMFLWFGTEHTTTDENYNLFWANPIHFILPLLLIFSKWRANFNRVFLFLSLFYFGFILFWFFLPQDLHSATRPLILTIGLRYYYWFRKTKSAAVTT
jgi:hypothetical protein